jgi:hypothetical protein
VRGYTSFDGRLCFRSRLLDLRLFFEISLFYRCFFIVVPVSVIVCKAFFAEN